MSSKKISAKSPTLSSEAVKLAIQLIKSDAVSEQLWRAPKAVVDWAVNLRRHAQGKRWPISVTKLNPADRFGQRGLERRVEKMSEALAIAFGGKANKPLEIEAALAELKTAIDVAGKLPITKRKPLHMRIDNELDALEKSLADAVLPKT